MEKSLVYGRERALEMLQMKLESRKIVHELIKSAVGEIVKAKS